MPLSSRIEWHKNPTTHLRRTRDTATARGRPRAELVMSGSEWEALKRLARQPSMPQAIAERGRIVLAGGDGQTNTAVADRLGGIRWNGSSPGEPSAANVLTSTFAPSEATVVRPAGGCSSVGPFWSAASVAVDAQALTSRSKIIRYLLVPPWWPALTALLRTKPPPEFTATRNLTPAGPWDPCRPALGCPAARLARWLRCPRLRSSGHGSLETR